MSWTLKIEIVGPAPVNTKNKTFSSSNDAHLTTRLVDYGTALAVAGGTLTPNATQIATAIFDRMVSMLKIEVQSAERNTAAAAAIVTVTDVILA